MANLVQKFIVEDASKASPILPQHVCFVTADGEPVGISKQDIAHRFGKMKNRA